MRFPTLNTGSIVQYPTTRVTRFRSQRIRFVDGTEQRLRQGRRVARSWIVHLEDLSTEEMGRVEEFVKAQVGAYQTFEFTDPFDGLTYPDCFFGTDEITLEWTEQERGKSVLWIHETGG